MLASMSCHVMQCGCCWAFAGTAAIESRALIALRKKASTYNIDLSEQQIVSERKVLVPVCRSVSRLQNGCCGMCGARVAFQPKGPPKRCTSAQDNTALAVHYPTTAPEYLFRRCWALLLVAASPLRLLRLLCCH